MHHFVRFGDEHRTQIEHAQCAEESDRDPGARQFEPRRRGPAARQQAHTQRDGHHHRAMAEGEEGAAKARPARVGAGVEARQPVDGGEVIGIEAVLETKHEHQQDEPKAIGGQDGHGSSRNARMN